MFAGYRHALGLAPWRLGFGATLAMQALCLPAQLIQLVLQDAELLLELSSKFAKILTCSSIGELARQPAAPGELFSKHLYFAIPVHLHETTEQQKRSNCVKRETAPVASPSGAANSNAEVLLPAGLGG